MSSLRYRFVSRDELPRNLSPQQLADFFGLTDEDITAVRNSPFEGHLGLALHVVFLRATGCFPAKAAVQPRSLLEHLCQRLQVRATEIGSLKTLYDSSRTLTSHRAWAREHCKFEAWAHAADGPELDKVMSAWAKSAVSVDDLVRSAAVWLFDNKRVYPGDRPVRDRARTAFAAVERLAVATIKQAVPAKALHRIVQMMREPAPVEPSKTMLEWLKDIPGKAGPKNFNEVADRIDVLKSIGAHEWDLSALNPERVAAFAQQVVLRPPYRTLRQIDSSVTTELVCFLRYRLLELTDQALFRVDRRVSELRRRAAQRTEGKQASRAAIYREALESVLSIAQDADAPAKARLERIVSLVGRELALPSISQEGVIRETLAAQGNLVHPVITRLLKSIDVQGEAGRGAAKLLDAIKQLHVSGARELPEDFDMSCVPRPWQQLVAVEDRAKALHAFEACAMQGIREGIRAGQLWVGHSARFRARSDCLIPSEVWAAQKAQLCSAWKLPLEAHEFLARRRANAQVIVQALSEAVAKGVITIDGNGQIRLPDNPALDPDQLLDSTRSSFTEMIGPAQLPDILIEIDAATNFSEMLLGRKAADPKALVAVYGALLAHGTEVDAKGVAAMIPGLEPAHITHAMRLVEAQGRLRKANMRVVEFQRRHAIARLWDDGSRASADMVALDASRHLYNARVDPKRRTFAIGLYMHVAGSYGVLYDTPIVLNTRQSSPAVNGVEAVNASGSERQKIDLLAVDTHGYTFVGMAVAKVLGFDLCPHLSQAHERRLFLPRGTKLPENLEGLDVEFVSDKRILRGWDEAMRLMASIKQGLVSPAWVLDRLGSAGRDESVQQAFYDLGRWIRTEFLGDFFTNPEFRRELRTLLNRGESVHQLQRMIYYGRVAPGRGRRHDELVAISGAHALLTNIVIAWNTMKLQECVDRLARNGQAIDQDLLRHVGPVSHRNINFRGRLSFGVEPYAETLLERPTRTRGAGRSG